MTRKVIIDVETTGTDIVHDDRIIAIGMVELLDNKPSGKTYYQEFNPGNVFINEENYSIHGLSNQYLSNKPSFMEHADEILKFISDSDIVIHNARFDILFLKKEYQRLGINDVLNRNKIICTVEMSRNVLPIFHVGLDKVAGYFGLRGRNQIHNALEDCQLLAQVYYLLNNEQNKQLDTSTSILDRFYPTKIDRTELGSIFRSKRMNVDFVDLLGLGDTIEEV